LNPKSGEALASLYQSLPGPLVRVPVRVAEMVKYVDNTFHALKVTFANEVGNLAKEFGVDSHRVMEIFCLDTKLNLSPYYLKPGFAFGGSCLPKDLRAITSEARMLDVTVPLLSSILESNRLQIQKVIKKLLEYKGKSLGFLGFSFKVAQMICAKARSSRSSNPCWAKVLTSKFTTAMCLWPSSWARTRNISNEKSRTSRG